MGLALSVGLIGAIATPAAAATPDIVTDPASYVNPLIGTTNGGDTYPGAATPFGMLAWSPQTSRGDQARNPAPGGYQYTAPRIRGFSLTHISGVGCGGGNGDIPIMPYVGDVDSSPTADTTDAKYASTYSHANEKAEPGYYRVGLDSGAGIEVTTTPRTGIGNITFPADKPASVLFRTSTAETGSADASVNIDAATNTVTGSVSAGNFCGALSDNNVKPYYTLHFTAHFDRPFAKVGTWKDTTVSPDATTSSGGTGWTAGRPTPNKGSGGYVTFAPGTTRVTAKVAISYVSQASAEANLASENPKPKTFASVRAAANAAWQKALRKIGVGGGTDDQKTVFYTALYHAMFEPTITSDVDGRYMGTDDKPHQLEPGQLAQYGTFSGWDVYRAQVQLLALLDPKMASDFAQSLYNYAKQRDGEWDRWLLVHGKTSVMSGDPAAAAVAGMYAFGARDFDVHGAFDSLVKAATVPTANDKSDAGCPVECAGQRPALDQYLAKGYVPADDCHCWGAAAETLEDAAADYGISQLAKALNEQATEKAFLARSKNWKNVYDPSARPDPGMPNNIRAHVTEITASAENAPGEGKTELVDGDLGSKWLTFAMTGWVAVKLDAPLTVTKYGMTSANDVPERDPKDWALEGSADGTTWTPIDTRTAQTFADRGVTNVYNVADPKPYQYYRLNVSANGGAPILQLAELSLIDPSVATPPPPGGPWVGYMRDRFADGTWADGFTPATDRGFVEGSSAQYTWMVYSDIVGVAKAMGGNETAIKRLDAFFRRPDGTFDFTGATGTHYDPTNEPDINSPYVYDYVGAPYKTQETTRAEIDQLWTNTTGGIPGNDDAGTMSAWYVFSALGAYPYVPTRADLALTAPLFPHAVIHLANGNRITIDAPQASAANKYIQGLTVRGRATTKPWIPASMLTTGGNLTFALGATADTSWGAGPGDTPPQATEPQSVGGTAVAAKAGKWFLGPVATVTDPDTAAAALTATVNWGDGTTSTATVTGTGGTYPVVGGHRYATAGSYTVTVTVSDPGEVSVATATTTAVVS